MMTYTDIVKHIADTYREEFEFLAYSDALYHWRDIYDALQILAENSVDLEQVLNMIPPPADFKTLCMDITEYLNSVIFIETQHELNRRIDDYRAAFLNAINRF